MPAPNPFEGWRDNGEPATDPGEGMSYYRRHPSTFDALAQNDEICTLYDIKTEPDNSAFEEWLATVTVGSVLAHLRRRIRALSIERVAHGIGTSAGYAPDRIHDIQRESPPQS